MRLTTTTAVLLLAVGLALLVPGGVLGIPGATGQTPTDTGPPSVSLTTPAEAPPGVVTETTRHGDGAIVETTLDLTMLDGLAGAMQPRQVAVVTNVDEHNRDTTVWINPETLAADGIELIDPDTGASLRGQGNAVKLSAGEAVTVSVDPDSIAATENTESVTVQFIVDQPAEPQHSTDETSGGE